MKGRNSGAIDAFMDDNVETLTQSWLGLARKIKLWSNSTQGVHMPYK